LASHNRAIVAFQGLEFLGWIFSGQEYNQPNFATYNGFSPPISATAAATFPSSSPTHSLRWVFADADVGKALVKRDS
jgi:hypothetical protein